MRIGFSLFLAAIAQTREESSPAGEQEADLGVRNEPFVNARYELFADVFANRLEVVMADLVDRRYVAVLHKFAVLVIMSGREGHNAPAHPDEVFRLACEHDNALFVIAVVERADTYRVSRGDVLFRLAVIDDERKLGVEHFEHIRAVFAVEREKYLTVGAAFKCIFLRELLFYLLVAVNLAVADDIAAVQLERLHPVGRQSHYRKAVEAEKALAGVYYSAVVRASRNGLVKALFKSRKGGAAVAVTHYRTHNIFPLGEFKHSIGQVL